VSIAANAPDIRSSPPPHVVIRRHSLVVRITHWINVLCILVLVMSGLQIFNAHPALYVGQKADFDHPVLSMSARNSPAGPIGETQILGARFNTTGFLGLSTTNGTLQARGFPHWLTLPSYQDLATGRRWHFFFAWLFVINGVIYILAALLNRHIARDLIPTGREIRGIGQAIRDHLALRFGHGRRYNVLQQLAYLSVIFVAFPLIIVAGMTMSPGLDTAFPWLVDLFQGRQTARTVHFIAATAIVLFVLVHLVMVLISGFWNNLRSIITGRYAINVPDDRHG
jgi:thiosulfate reductase cytochrome b subunit